MATAKIFVLLQFSLGIADIQLNSMVQRLN